MKVKADRHFAEVATSGRAGCRRCKQVIRKGEARLVVVASVRPGHFVKLFKHIGCASSADLVAIKRAYGALGVIPCAPGCAKHDVVAALEAAGVKHSARTGALGAA